MNPTFFFILTITLISGTGIVYAESYCTTNCSSTITTFLNPPICEDSKIYDIETFECISKPEPPKPTPPRSSSGGSNGGGCGITGVGPGGSHGHGGASGAIGKDCGRTGVGPGDSRPHISSYQLNISSDTIPLWVSNVILWWLDDKITQEEFKNIITYLLDQNIIPNNTSKPDTVLVEFTPTTKQIFELWANGHLQDSYILKIIQDYRQLGIW